MEPCRSGKPLAAGMNGSLRYLPVELDWVKTEAVCWSGEVLGWGAIHQMIYDAIVNGATFESFTNSGMDLVTINNVEAMAEAWATNDFTKPLPAP
jgi:ribose transport system substrate-binding protein